MAATASFAPRLVLGESPRWHAGRLWACDWERRELVAVDARGGRQVMATVPSAPFAVDWSADGTLFVLAGPDLLAGGRDGLRPVADMRPLGADGWNEIVVGAGGDAYVNSVGRDPATEPRTGTIALVATDGSVRQVADGLASPSGMAVTPDGATLLVAESSAHRITAFDVDPAGGLGGRRVWAHLGHAVPGGLCLDADGAVWCADVPGRRCIRVREGGEVLDVVATDRGWFSCALGDEAHPTLYVVGAFWTGLSGPSRGEPTGRVLTVPAPAPAPAPGVPAGPATGRDPAADRTAHPVAAGC
jgi:sugar lactone lactonase YvrE